MRAHSLHLCTADVTAIAIAAAGGAMAVVTAAVSAIVADITAIGHGETSNVSWRSPHDDRHAFDAIQLPAKEMATSCEAAVSAKNSMW
jgi:hypothetical protein